MRYIKRNVNEVMAQRSKSKHPKKLEGYLLEFLQMETPCVEVTWDDTYLNCHSAYCTLSRAIKRYELPISIFSVNYHIFLVNKELYTIKK